MRDRVTKEEYDIRSKYLVGADGGNSKVAEDAGLPMVGKMGVGGSINIIIKADLSKYVAHRPSVLYWVLAPGSNVGGIGMGVVRMVRPWNEWLLIWGYDITQPPPKVTEKIAEQLARQLIGDDEIPIEVKSWSTWTVNHMHATNYQKGRVFCMGDAVHRHPPSNGLGSNTSIQDAYNLAWKLALVLKGQAAPSLLDTYTPERAPIGKQIVNRANQSISEFGPIFGALGLLESTDPHVMKANMESRKEDDEGRQRTAPEAARSDRLQGLRVRRAWRRHEPALQVEGHRLRRLEGPGLPRRSGARPPADDLSGRAAAACLAAEGRGEAVLPRSLRQGPLHADHLDRRRRVG